MTITSASMSIEHDGEFSPAPGGARASILLIEDSLAQASAYRNYLLKAGYSVEHVTNGEEALSALASRPPSLVILDLCLPGIQGDDVLRRMRAEGRSQPVIVITDYASIDTAVGAMRNGAYDFLAKPFDASRIRVTVENALREQDGKEIAGSHREPFEGDRFHGFIGSSDAMHAVYHLVRSAATSRATIFITGESGTGKELCAQAIHAQSRRADGPFVAINCAAIPSALMESEIFGHVKGAFTGADARRDGAALEADGGTLFFDEICEMDLDLQAKLLRFIQTGTFRQVGSSEETEVDVRFVCATNRDALEEVNSGRFREDLYYRLHVVPIDLPSLRERRQDIMPIGNHFLREISAEEGKGFRRFSAAAEDLLMNYSWPGNVRQLENIVRSIVILHDGDEVTAEMIPAPISSAGKPEQAASAAAATPGDESIRSLRDIERETIENAIAACGGNVVKAAASLGVSPSTLYRKRQAWLED